MFVFICVVPVLLLAFLLKFIFTKPPKSISKKHVLVTGGSSGIGKSIALLAAEQGAHVTIVARNVENLKATENEIKKMRINESQKIQHVSLDVSNYEDVENAICNIEKEVGPIFMIVNCAGVAICGKVEDMAISDVKKMIDTNYYGTYYPVKAVISRMKSRKEGIIVLTGSQASLFGIFGYSAYAASKFALRGFAEALDMEVRPYNITVTLALPADTDTPGYKIENLTKLKETHLICESGGLFKPEDVAKKIMKDATAGNFFSYLGLESFFLTNLCVGMSPFSSVFEVMYQSLLLGPLKIICCVYLTSYHRIIKKCAGIEN